VKAGPLQSTSQTLHDAVAGDKIWPLKIGYFWVKDLDAMFNHALPQSMIICLSSGRKNTGRLEDV
jgi:hypothetical protein